DSFSKLGGTVHFEKARNIANIAQFEEAGWTQGESTNNRYWLIENLNNQQLVPVREALYAYHRKAMDTFIKDPEQSRKEIFDVLKKIRQARQYSPFSILIKSFFLAKTNELINVYKGSSSPLRAEVLEILRELD